MPANDVTATPISALRYYSIIYNNVEGAVMQENPSEYSVETPSFTLNNPSKTGYVFVGWTGSNGNTPESSVTISQ